MSQRPFAAFDLDGTLLRWQLYHAVVQELATQNFIASKDYEQVRRARTQWKNRQSPDAYPAYEHLLIAAFQNALADIPLIDFQAACLKVIDHYKDQTYLYTRQRLRDLRAQGYLLFALSASQIDIVAPFAEYYNFDDYDGSKQTIVDGKYTGNSQILNGQQKVISLQALVARHNASWQGSIAIGDSEGDIPLLSEVEHPVAFNPTHKLYEHARLHAWDIVIERKSQIYTLVASGSQYLLT